MAEQIKDQRTPLEQAKDIVDVQLLDFFQEAGLIEAGEDVTYSREELMNVARNAYLKGVADKTTDPEAMARTSVQLNEILSKGTSDTRSRS